MGKASKLKDHRSRWGGGRVLSVLTAWRGEAAGERIEEGARQPRQGGWERTRLSEKS